MRQKLKTLLAFDWLETSFGHGYHVDRILKLKLTRAEKLELCKRLKTETDETRFSTLTGVMKYAPELLYYKPLLKALDAKEPFKRHNAIFTLLRGNYKNAVTILLSRRDLYEPFGDHLVTELPRKDLITDEPPENDLTAAQRDTFCEIFARHFTPTPKLDWQKVDWIIYLEQLAWRHRKIPPILIKLWQTKPHWEFQAWILRAMLVAPHRHYLPIFKEASVVKNPTVKSLGKKGLRLF